MRKAFLLFLTSLMLAGCNLPDESQNWNDEYYDNTYANNEYEQDTQDEISEPAQAPEPVKATQPVTPADPAIQRPEP